MKEIGPYLKTCPKVHSWKVSKLPFGLRQSGPESICSSQHRLPRPEAPAAGRLVGTGTHHPPEETSDMRPEMQMSIDTARFSPPRFIKSECTYCTLDHTCYNVEREFTPRWNYYDLGHLAHTQEQLKLRCLTAWTSREMQIKLQRDSRIQPPIPV